MKKIRKFMLNPSDKIAMTHAALDMVGIFRRPANPEGQFPQPMEMDDIERSAYRSALGFLSNQFDLGPREDMLSLVENSVEDTEVESEPEGNGVELTRSELKDLIREAFELEEMEAEIDRELEESGEGIDRQRSQSDDLPLPPVGAPPSPPPSDLCYCEKCRHLHGNIGVDLELEGGVESDVESEVEIEPVQGLDLGSILNSDLGYDPNDLF